MWTDNAKELLSQVEVMQDAMMNYVWSSQSGTLPTSSIELEKAAIGEATVESESVRPTWHQAPIMGGLAIGLNVFISAIEIRKLLVEYLTDGEPMRFLILISLPFQFCVLQFFLVSP